MDQNSKVLLMDETRSPLKLLESKSTPEGRNTGAVLATLFGTLSDFGNETRNGRWYTGSLWQKVLNSDLLKEALETKTLYGEADHPLDVEDRAETHIPYVSHIVREPRINEQKQVVEGFIDVLDTPNGRIVKTLLDYGCILGVSSRGSGDLTYIDGKTTVDEDTYNFITWDIVARPSNKKARVNEIDTIDMVTGRTAYESLKSQVNEMINNGDKVGLKLAESLISSTDIPDKDKVVKLIKESIESDQKSDEDGTASKIDDNMVPKSDLDEAYNRILELKSENSELGIENKSLSSELAIKDNTISELSRANENLTSMVTSYMENINAESNKNDSKDTTEDDHLEDAINSEEQDPNEEKEDNQYNKLGESIENQFNKSNLIIDAGFKKLSEKFDQLVKESDSKRSIDSLNERVKELSTENKSLREQLNTSQDENVRLIRKTASVMNEYFRIRCSQLGLNESIARKEFNGHIQEYDLSDVNDVLNELYESSSSSRTLNESVSDSSQGLVGSIQLVGQLRSNKPNLSTGEHDESDEDYDFLTESIRQTRNA